ncbi:MAG: DUF456 domain-containing protein [Paludibacteraceae bacterium]|nr:DUF456 domain-containing protein [Paludibacteraceae bacterium]
MDYFLLITGAICMIVGILGSFLPILPGPPLSYLGVVLLHFTSKSDFSWQFFLFWGIVVVVVMVLDYLVPIWGTKKFGGGRRGAWGSALGVLVGVFVLPPWGIIIFPFFGAVLGELSEGKQLNLAIKAGVGSFIGFLSGIVFKFVVSLALAYFFFKDVLYILWQVF